MPLDSPLTLGPFTVDEAGRLAPGSRERFPAFHLAWRGRKVHVCMSNAEDDTGLLSVEVVVGRVPSTGGPSIGRPPGQGLALRAGAFATIASLPPSLPAGWTVALLPDHTLCLSAGLALHLPATASELLTVLTGFLLALAPYLDVADEGGLDASGSGMPRTCPG